MAHATTRDPYTGVQIRIGVMGSAGGDLLLTLEASLSKDTGAEVVHESDPQGLLDRLLGHYLSPEYVCPCRPAARG